MLPAARPQAAKQVGGVASPQGEDDPCASGSFSVRALTMTIKADYLSTATALQKHESMVLRRYREWLAADLREEADRYELRALNTPEPVLTNELTWIALGLRAAAVKVDPE